MKESDFPRKKIHLSKAILHKKPWLAALRLRCVGMRSGTDQGSVCLSALLLLQGEKMRAGQAHEES